MHLLLGRDITIGSQIGAIMVATQLMAHPACRWLGRVRQQGKKLGRPKVPAKVEEAIREHLAAGHGILKVAAMVRCGSGTVQRIRREMAAEMAEAA